MSSMFSIRDSIGHRFRFRRSGGAVRHNVGDLLLVLHKTGFLARAFVSTFNVEEATGGAVGWLYTQGSLFSHSWYTNPGNSSCMRASFSFARASMRILLFVHFLTRCCGLSALKCKNLN